MFRRLSDSLGQLRPRSLARTAKAVDDLLAETRELKRAIKQLADGQERIAGESAQWHDESRRQLAALGDIREMLSALAAREAQLRAITLADAALEDAYEELDTILDEQHITAHIRKMIGRAELKLEPFP